MPSFTFALIIALLSTSAFADITLVRDGNSEAVIIVPEGLSKHVQKPVEQLTSEAMSVPLAAVALADYLQKIRGARPVIATETQKDVGAASRAKLQAGLVELKSQDNITGDTPPRQKSKDMRDKNREETQKRRGTARRRLRQTQAKGKL